MVAPPQAVFELKPTTLSRLHTGLILRRTLQFDTGDVQMFKGKADDAMGYLGDKALARVCLAQKIAQLNTGRLPIRIGQVNFPT